MAKKIKTLPVSGKDWLDQYLKQHEGPAPKRGRKSERPFFYFSESWHMAAADVLLTSDQLRIAGLLYRRWYVNKKNNGGGAVVASDTGIACNGWTPALKARARVIKRLAKAGLLRITEVGGPGKAPRIEIIDPAT
jgi:hypothetical protein